MSPERFIELVDAYGGDIGRWPERERMAARERVATGPESLRRALAQAIDLDTALRQFTVEPASLALHERMAQSAPVVARAKRPRGWFGFGGLWSGIGIAGIGMAGVAAGAFAVSMALSLAAPSGVDTGWGENSAGAFSNLAADFGEE